MAKKKADIEKGTISIHTENIFPIIKKWLYSDKEIFLRELIANSSDACDKLRFATVQDASLMEDGEELAITIDIDKDARTLTITDNGIGMSHDEVIQNLGTIASSGTRKFVESLSGDEAKVWDLTAEERPLSELVALAQLLGGHRIDESGVYVPLDSDQLKVSFEQLGTN